MQKPKGVKKRAVTTLDTSSQKRGRGRPRRVNPSEVLGRAENYRRILTQIWDVIGERLIKAHTEEDVTRALEMQSWHLAEFHPIAGLILKVVRHKRFPERRQPRINFLADSIAAYGTVSARRSRDICNRERSKATKAHRILRAEYYIVCSCGHKGPSQNHVCPKCKAEIPFNLVPAVSPISLVT